jgi:hypothetical protein
MRDNDQNRWEYEVQRHYEREETKAQLLEMSYCAVVWTLFAALMYAILAA